MIAYLVSSKVSKTTIQSGFVHQSDIIPFHIQISGKRKFHKFQIKKACCKYAGALFLIIYVHPMCNMSKDMQYIK